MTDADRRLDQKGLSSARGADSQAPGWVLHPQGWSWPRGSLFGFLCLSSDFTIVGTIVSSRLLMKRKSRGRLASLPGWLWFLLLLVTNRRWDLDDLTCAVFQGAEGSLSQSQETSTPVVCINSHETQKNRNQKSVTRTPITQQNGAENSEYEKCLSRS